jgi:hypothetical protein
MLNQMFSPQRLLATGLLVITLLQYIMVSDSFYLDADDWFIVDMGRQVSENPTPDHFIRFWSAEPTWRPLLTARAGLEYQLFAADIQPRLTANLVLHLISAVLLYLAVMTWFQRPRVAVWASLLFAAHPLHAESLVWFHSGFEGITVTVFALLTVYSVGRRDSLWRCLFFFQLALFTRENALCLPLLIGAGAWMRSTAESRLKQAIGEVAPYIAVVFVNILFRYWLLSNAEHNPTGSFHLGESLSNAMFTTFVHPWLPVHPALPARTFWWALWSGVFIGLCWFQKGRPKQMLWVALIGFGLASSPFIPNFDDAWRFIAALPGGYEQRWYFFHLPLAFLSIWPAYIAVQSAGNRVRREVLIAGGLLAISLTTWSYNAAWYQAQAGFAKRVFSTVDAALSQVPTSIGVSVTEGLDSSEIADQIFLNAPIIWPDAFSRGVRSYHQRVEAGETRLQEARKDARGQVGWVPVTGLKPQTRWWRWDTKEAVLTSVPTPR